MSDARTPKTVMAELLKLSPEERAAVKPRDGIEEAAKAYIHKAISETDGAMLKYLFDSVDKTVEQAPEAAKGTMKTKLDKLAEIAMEGIDE